MGHASTTNSSKRTPGFSLRPAAAALPLLARCSANRVVHTDIATMLHFLNTRNVNAHDVNVDQSWSAGPVIVVARGLVGCLSFAVAGELDQGCVQLCAKASYVRHLLALLKSG